jgi:hypothetical protein
VAPGRRARLSLRLDRPVRTRTFDFQLRVDTRNTGGRRLVLRADFWASIVT